MSDQKHLSPAEQQACIEMAGPLYDKLRGVVMQAWKDHADKALTSPTPGSLVAGTYMASFLLVRSAMAMLQQMGAVSADLQELENLAGTMKDEDAPLGFVKKNVTGPEGSQ